jgi:hypothetical protein
MPTWLQEDTNMNARELLRQELERRQAQQLEDEGKLRGLVEAQEKLARSAPDERTDLSPTLNYVSQLTGMDISSGYQRPESAKESLRKALLARSQMPKAKTDALYTALAKSDKGQGLRQLSASDVMKVQEGANVPMMLDDVGNVIEANSNIFGPVQGRVENLSPWNTQARTVDAQMRAASQAFGRFMEGGVLRKEDEEKYRKMFPNLSDTPSVARNKLDIVRNLLNQRQSGNVQALSRAGFDTSAFSQQAPQQDIGSIDLTQMSEEQLRKLAGGR